MKSGNYQSAQHQYEKALKLNKTNVQLLCNKGIASERLGAFSKAATAYKKALVLDPKNHPAAYNYSLLMLKLGFYEKGWDLYENRWETPEFTTAKRQFNVPLWQGDSISPIRKSCAMRSKVWVTRSNSCGFAQCLTPEN